MTLSNKIISNGLFDKNNIIKVEDVKELLKNAWVFDITAEQLADVFHHTYELYSISNGWKTQKKCRVKFDDLPEKNKETMIDTCQHIILMLEAMQCEKINKLAGKELTE